MAFTACDLLDEALPVTTHGRHTFRTLYQEVVDYALPTITAANSSPWMMLRKKALPYGDAICLADCG